ncbi:MAG: NAD(P)-binding domain-containing protein [Bacteroidales bacterium]|jgi:glycerol-3-phosphate dehydrogenase (NAD(P)+)|nr:NAD(P)-binding domain-containing protein [Bacteroidales bacterium]
MENRQPHLAFIGAGAIGTALGNILAGNAESPVLLHSIEPQVVEDINTKHINSKYFPTIRLRPRLTASSDDRLLEEYDILFLAIPSEAVMDYLKKIKNHIPPKTLLVNLAKGFGAEHKTVFQCIRDAFPNPVCTLKGPGFAREIINQSPTGFTLGYETYSSSIVNQPASGIQYPASSIQHPASGIPFLFRETNIYFDYSSDCQGVEILSILKNIYAVVMGIVDAQFNSPNLRFLILTKAFREMRHVLHYFGGKEETLFNYCGYGDFALTALNDLSRNRTLGLLIGKGFFTKHVSHDLVLEGKTAVNVFYSEISKKMNVAEHFPILAELYKIFSTKYDVSAFVNTILNLAEGINDWR